MKSSQTSFSGAVIWSFLDNISGFFVTLIVSAVLARLIAPSEFGLLAMVGVFIGFLSVFKNFGLNSSLIHKKNPTKQEIDSIFWISVFITAGLSLIIFLGAPYIARFYDNPRLTEITYGLALIFFLGSLSSIPDALIRKALDFRTFFLRNISNKLISGAIGILLAFKDFGVWALIAQNFVSTLYITYISFRMVEWRPSFYLNFKILKPHFNYGIPLIALRIFYHLTNSIDSILIGKFYGPTQLAYYNKAFSLMKLPLGKISTSVSRVVFPSFALINNRNETIWKKYLKLLSVTAYISFPLMAIMFLMADEIILTVFGDKWRASIPIFKAFAFVGAIQTLTYSGTILQSIGKTKLLFVLNSILKGIMIVLIVAGLYFFKIPGAITGYSLGMLLELIFGSYFLAKSIAQNPFDVYKSISKEFSITLLFTFMLYFTMEKFRIENVLIKLVLIFFGGVLPYLILSAKWNLEGYIFIRQKTKDLLLKNKGK